MAPNGIEQAPHRASRTLGALTLKLFAVAAAVSSLTCGSDPAQPTFEVTIQVVGENGAPASGVTIDARAVNKATDASGQVGLTLSGPEVLLIGSDRHITEVVPVGWEDVGSPIRVRLLDKKPRRFVMHSGGDVMFGRRYNMPTTGTALIPESNVARGAMGVVSRLVRGFTAADFRVFNLETAVTSRAMSEAYPGKRFILKSLPDTLEGVRALNATVVTLANNHIRDFLDAGVTDTIQALEARGIPYVGASTGADPGDAPKIIETNGVRVATLSYSTVDGGVVNDAYPDDGDTMPTNISDRERWQWDARVWEFNGPTWTVPSAARRIGSAWRLFKDKESDISRDEAASAWTSLVRVYPELQDWVARRGHGGAAWWTTTGGSRQIRNAVSMSDLVVVQLHAGFQFMPVGSVNVRNAARAAIDAGAHIVICHHPHVLQGAEWYKGKLIVFSLGNFIFDQDFLATFQSAFLRTVWDGNELVEARFVPVELQAYQPALATGRAARRTMRAIWENSVARASASRDSRGDVRVRRDDTALMPGEGGVEAHLRFAPNGVKVETTALAPVAQTMGLPAGAVVALAADGLVNARLGGAGELEIDVGRELLGWGDFEDLIADDAPHGSTHWVLDPMTSKTIDGTGGTVQAAFGRRFLRLTRAPGADAVVIARPVARAPLPWHRLYSASDPVTPLDSSPTYTFRFSARKDGGASLTARVDFYSFDDTNPTEDPESVSVGRYERVFQSELSTVWSPINIDIPDSALTRDGERANMALISFLVGPTAKGTTIDIDGVELIEWRKTGGMPDQFGSFTHARNRTSGDVQVIVSERPSM